MTILNGYQEIYYEGYPSPYTRSIPAFELDGLLLGGHHSQIQVESFEPGVTDIKTQDAQNGAGDGVIMGRDTYGGSTWAFTFFTDAGSDEEALDLADHLAAVWRNDDIRDTPTVVKALRYYMAGRWRRVYGRPRRFAGPDGGLLTIQGRATMVADFQRVDHLHYDDEEQVAGARLIPTTIGGFTAPFVAPIEFEQADETYTPGTFTVGGSAPTYPVIEVEGPATDPWVEAAGWRLQLRGAILAGSVVTVDTRPWARYAAVDGVPTSGVVAQSTRLTDLVLRPGNHQISYGGYGGADQARATIRWRNARYSL